MKKWGNMNVFCPPIDHIIQIILRFTKKASKSSALSRDIRMMQGVDLLPMAIQAFTPQIRAYLTPSGK
jgi:hypothetical protein